MIKPKPIAPSQNNYQEKTRKIYKRTPPQCSRIKQKIEGRVGSTRVPEIEIRRAIGGEDQ